MVTKKIIVALDAMGGDRAPEIVVEGAALARERHLGVHYLFFGIESKIKPLLEKHKELSKVSEIVHTDDVISADVRPSAALRTGRKSSMWLAVESVRDELAGGVVSAGNTGALMASSRYVLGMIPGIMRPAIASFLPTPNGECVMLDLGANAESAVEHLVQFAIMGDAFARTTLGLPEPKIGLLNIGTEETKGTESVRQAYAVLKKMSSNETDFPLNFHGFIEGNDIALGTTDIVVTDGFSGNVALKAIEGTSKLFSALLKQTVQHSIWAKIGFLLAKPAFDKLKERVDPRRYNGAVFLGINGSVVKSHGGTDAFGFSNAIGITADMIHNGFIDRVRDEIERISHLVFSKSV